MEAHSPQQTPLKISICGGGIGGLVLAIGLIKQNIDVTVYEQSASFREIGAGIGFSKNSMTAMQLIDPALYARFESIATHNGSEAAFDTWFDFYAGMKIGGVSEEAYIDTVKVDARFAKCNTSRSELLDEMVKMIPSGVAQFNKRVISIHQDDAEKVVIKFADGTKAEADAVIGCDGIRSISRQIVLSDDASQGAPVFTSKYAYRGLVPMDRAIAVLGKGAAITRRMYLGHHGHLVCFPVVQGKLMNVVAFKNKNDGIWDRATWIEPTTKDEMVRDFSGFSDTVLKILELMDQPERWAIFDHEPAATFYKDRICLLGDSAHASSPHFGVGAGMAVEDAYVLSNLLGACKSPEALKSAFAAYDAIRRPRTHRVTQASRTQGRFWDLEEPEQWKGDEIDLGIVRKGLKENIQFIWMVDLPGELAAAKSLFYQLEESRSSLKSGSNMV